MPTTRLLLVRHGGTLLSIEDRFAGSTDVDLSDEGRQQALSLSRRLANTRIDAAYCSPMRRTIDTAAAVCRPHNLTPASSPGLREIDHGHWEGMRHKDVEANFPAEYAAWSADPFLCPPTAGESGLEVLARALPAVRNIVAANPGRTVLAVSHKATIRLVVCALLGLDARLYRQRLQQDLACLNILDFFDPSSARLVLLNDISHYSPAPV